MSDTSDDQPCWRRRQHASRRKGAGDGLRADRLRANGIGWYNATLGLLGLVASVVAGLLWDHVSHAAVFLYGAAFAIAGSIALMALVPAMQIRRPTSHITSAFGT